jgi:hypothetical protein
MRKKHDLRIVLHDPNESGVTANHIIMLLAEVAHAKTINILEQHNYDAMPMVDHACDA